MLRMRLIAVLILFLSVGHGLMLTEASARRIERLMLEPNTMAEMSALLSSGDALHSALTKQEDEQVEVALRDIEIAVKRTMAMSARIKMHERAHLLKILESIDENVEVARNSGHSDRRDRISDVFNMMANLVRIYSVDARYKIFFCARDKMTWVQTKPRGIYPFPEGGYDDRSPSGVTRDCALRAP